MRRINNIVLPGDFKVYGLKVVHEDQVRYIGITRRQLSKRLQGHKKEANRNPHKINWIKKHSGNIEAVLIEDGIATLQQANQKEKNYIQLFKALGAKLLNSTLGGDGTHGLPPWNRGKKCFYSDKLISNSPQAKKVYCYDLNGNFHKEYRSVKYAASVLCIARQSIKLVADLRPKYKQSGGYQFRWVYAETIPAVSYDEGERARRIKEGKRIAKHKKQLYAQN